MPEPLTTALLTVAAKEAVKAIVKPMINGALKGAALVTEVAIDTFTNQFVAYIERQLEKNSYLNTLVFQNQVPLEDLYIPLTVIQQSAEVEDPDAGILINHFAKEFIPQHKRVLITDTAGMGKSTLMRYLLLQCIKSNFSIPVFIELRHLSESRTVLSLLENELNLDAPEGSERFTSERIAKILKKGQMLFFFDGYDEIPFKDREAVTKDIKNFIDLYPANSFALTSRPESGLSAFPSFAHFRIRPLKKTESFQLIQKYDKNGVRSDQLIKRLQGPELRAVHEFLQNPLLTTLLYRCFEYKQNIPEKKHIFYRQVFDALYDWHDASKDGYNTREKKSKLDLDGFHRVLRAVGFISILNGEVEGDKDKVLGWIRDAKRVCVGMSFSENDFLLDATTAVPVLVKDGLFYKWSHKSLAEYFAAQYICSEGKEQQADVFNHMVASGNLARFYNMLDQLYDLDQPAFRKYFTRPFAQAFVEFKANAYRNVSPSIPAEEVELRRGATFVHPSLITRGKQFPRGEELRRELARLNYDNSKTTVESIFDLDFGLLSPIKIPNITTPMVIVLLSCRFSVIGEILGAKQDALTIPLKKIENKVRPLKNLGRRNIFAVTDDPTDILNSEENFAATTRALIARPYGSVVIDAQACESFLATYADEQTKVDFTQNLLARLSMSSE